MCAERPARRKPARRPNPSGERTRLTLAPGEYQLRWYDPRNGGELETGREATLRDEGTVTISPPHHPGKDWVALIEKRAAP